MELREDIKSIFDKHGWIVAVINHSQTVDEEGKDVEGYTTFEVKAKQKAGAGFCIQCKVAAQVPGSEKCATCAQTNAMTGGMFGYQRD